MNQHKLAQLRQELLNSGYSAAYVRRLVSELCDHLACIEEEADSPCATGIEAESRLGDQAEILDAVRSFPELVSIPNRYPFLTYAIIPAVLLLLGHFGWLSFANAISQTRPFEIHSWNQWLAVTMEWSSFLFPVVVSLIASWTAFRLRSKWDLPLISAAVMGISSCFSLNAVVCDHSQMLVCQQAWEFDAFQMFLVLTPALCCIVALRFFGREYAEPDSIFDDGFET